MTHVPHRKRLGFFTRLLDETGPAERYRLAAAQISRAEELGFDTAWVAQHHFHADEGGLPSPAVFLAHVAARTSTIRLGTGVITLPMENPLRVAEDTAVADILSGGRLEVGFGTGGTRESFEAFGVPADKRGEIYGRHLDVVRKAWAGEDLGAGNRLHPDAPQLLDHVWLATFSAFGAKLAGATGDGLMLSRTQPRPAEAPDLTLDAIQNPIIDAYLAALPVAREPRILASRSLFVAEDRGEALRLAEIGLERAAARLRAAGQPAPEGSLAEIIARWDLHVGTPDDVIATLSADSALARATDLVFQVHPADPPAPYVLRSIALLAQEVAPALGWKRRAPAPPVVSRPTIVATRP